MNQPLAEYLVITTLATFGLIAQVWWRLTHPFHCTCGYHTLFARRMFQHLQIKHGYYEPKDQGMLRTLDARDVTCSINRESTDKSALYLRLAASGARTQRGQSQGIRYHFNAVWHVH